ncbi:aminoglycoside 3'-phosphotransferase [Zhihengliuella salsuginis]|uniref:Phosphotransferase n=1 Tax=Zhihengliuella salsuginis TaxID=578222 RepID=A0ABQ3GAL0_9MICC|nr:aminoglycoside 3'-phosphotransferase [Zhihengliuella salsuginis]GHC99907.1 putative phosphotransferase [Zhihengliuella salsuginis]
MTYRPLAAAPEADVAVPAPVAEYSARVGVAPGGITPVWRNQLGGLTFRLSLPSGDVEYAKWSPAAAGVDLGSEAERLTWAAGFTSVPRPVRTARHDDGSQLLVTAAVPGDPAVAPRWVAQPERAAGAIGTGLRALHDALPVDDCPFDWSLAARLADAEDPERGRALAAEAPGIDRLVVCHGDACAPNTLINEDGRWSAHVDLGSLGVADFWADLAIAAWSTVWNYGPGFEQYVYDGYGVEPDEERIAFYRDVWDAT